MATLKKEKISFLFHQNCRLLQEEGGSGTGPSVPKRQRGALFKEGVNLKWLLKGLCEKRILLLFSEEHKSNTT